MRFNSNIQDSEFVELGVPPLPPPPPRVLTEQEKKSKREIILETDTDPNFKTVGGKVPQDELDVIKEFLRKQKAEKIDFESLLPSDENDGTFVVETLQNNQSKPVRSKFVDLSIVIVIVGLMFFSYTTFQQKFVTRTPEIANKDSVSKYPVALSEKEIDVGENEVVIKSPESEQTKASEEVSEPVAEEAKPKEEMVISVNEGTVVDAPPAETAENEPPKEETKEYVATGKTKTFYDTYTSGDALDLDNDEAARQEFLATNKVVVTPEETLPKASEIKPEVEYPTAPQSANINDYNTPYNAGGDYDLDGDTVRQQYLEGNVLYTRK